MSGGLKLDIIKVNGLSQILSTEGGSKKLTERFMYTNAAKSTINSVLIDQDEEWQCRQLNMGGIKEVLGMFFALACGAADIPATRLLGKSPDGMNATGDSDLRNYCFILVFPITRKSMTLQDSTKLGVTPLNCGSRLGRPPCPHSKFGRGAQAGAPVDHPNSMRRRTVRGETLNTSATSSIVRSW